MPMSDVRTILERGVGEAKPPPDGFDRMLRRRERKRRAQRLRAGALGIVLTLAGVAVAVVAIRSANVPADETPSPRPTPSPSLEPLFELGRGIYLVDVASGEVARMPRSVISVRGADRYDVSPDGTRLLFEGLDPDGTAQVFVADVDGTGVRQLTDDPDGAYLGGWSSDGRELVYIGAWRDGEANMNEEVVLVVMNVDTGQARSVITGRAGNLQQPHFSPDGESILFTRPSDPPDLWSVPVEGGTADLFLEERGYASFSPDGTAMVLSVPTYVSTGHGGFGPFPEIWLARPDGSDPRPLVQEDASELRGDLFNENPQWSPDGTRIVYSDGVVHVVDVLTGGSTTIAEGYGYDWLDADTLIVRRR
jgi:Tol biopolymer transport system component